MVAHEDTPWPLMILGIPTLLFLLSVTIIVSPRVVPCGACSFPPWLYFTSGIFSLLGSPPQFEFHATVLFSYSSVPFHALTMQ